MEQTTETIKQAIDDAQDVDWYEKFEAVPGSGVYTPGWNDRTDGYVGRLKFLGMKPSDFEGLHVLEIGSYSGSWTFLMEEWGASVTAIDPYDPDKTGFSLIHKLRGSKIRHFQCSVYDVSPNFLGHFDLVSFYGVFYHLKHPLLAFERLASCLKANGMIIGAGTSAHSWFHNADPSCGGGVDLRYVTKDNYTGDPKKFTIATLHGLPIAAYADRQFLKDHTNWFMPNQALLQRWLEDTGFEVQKIRTFTTPLLRDWNDSDIERSSTSFVAKKTGEPRPEYVNPHMVPYNVGSTTPFSELEKRRRL